MFVKVSIPADQYAYLEAKSATLGYSISILIRNLLAFGRLTPPAPASESPRSSFLPRGVKRPSKKAAK